MRILFIGDAAATGFGTVTSDLGRALLDLGEDVRFLSQNALGTIPEPLGSRTYSLDERDRPETVLAMLKGLNGWVPEAIIVLGDYFAARWIVADPRVTEALAAVPSFHYCPVEGVDLPRNWHAMWDVVKPVAMTNFGAEQIAKVVGYTPPMVYHGVDQETFYPLAPNRPANFKSENGGRATNKASAKAHFGLDPGRIALVRTDRHMPRKMYNRMLRALFPVVMRNPLVDIVIHCQRFDFGGFLNDTIAKYPPEFQKRIYMTDAYESFTGIAREELNVLYNAADVYVTVSAEGFGLTAAEAVACGVPVVGIDYAALPEVIGPAGLVARVSHLVDNEYDHFWAAVDELDFGEKVERLVRKPSLRRQMGSAGPAHVAKNFSWSRAAEQFRDLCYARLEAAA
jgi:glycosyltransferase involved in cell wall biosynthesis